MSARVRAGARFSPPELVVAVKAIACELPSRLGLPLSRLNTSDIREEVIARGLVAEISGATIWRWLDQDAIKPWTHRSWIFPRDPDFGSKAGRVLDVYARCFEGRALQDDEFVISADEKTSIQARIRCHPTVAGNRAHLMLVEHESDRGGSVAYMAAWDVHRAKLFGLLEPASGIRPFDTLVAQILGQEPYRSARRVFLVVDNGSSHRGAKSVERLQGNYANLRLVRLPIHASWLNQIEIYFSVLERKVLTPADRTSLTDLRNAILDFQSRYELLAKPFEWKVTRADLSALLRRLEDRELSQHLRAAWKYITEFMSQSTKLSIWRTTNLGHRLRRMT